MYKEISVDNFQDRTLHKCILAGYEDKKLITHINKIDPSVYNPIANAFYDDAIDAFLKPKLQKFKLDSANSREKVSEAKAGKIVFDNCLLIYKSRELKHFAKKQVNFLRKKDNLEKIFDEKNPAF